MISMTIAKSLPLLSLLNHRQESLRADEAFQQVVEEKQRTEQEKQQADRLAVKLRELGIDPEDAQNFTVL
jgi:hypothetical protein